MIIVMYGWFIVLRLIFFVIGLMLTILDFCLSIVLFMCLLSFLLRSFLLLLNLIIQTLPVSVFVLPLGFDLSLPPTDGRVGAPGVFLPG